VLEIELTFQRQRFHQFFEQPAPYYYGVNPADLDSVSESDRLATAARQSTEGEGSLISTLRQVPESAIHTVWRALQYPVDYWDVIDKESKFLEGALLFLEPGLRDYICHARTWHSAAGRLWVREPPPAAGA
jgi:hypothetical protein